MQPSILIKYIMLSRVNLRPDRLGQSRHVAGPSDSDPPPPLSANPSLPQCARPVFLPAPPPSPYPPGPFNVRRRLQGQGSGGRRGIDGGGRRRGLQGALLRQPTFVPVIPSRASIGRTCEAWLDVIMHKAMHR